jgi:hypothetical protein
LSEMSEIEMASTGAGAAFPSLKEDYQTSSMLPLEA